MALTASMEDYLEAIYQIDKNNQVARVKDIARRLNVTMPSVHAALKQLKEQKLVRHASYGYVELTHHGIKASEKIVRRHEILKEFLFDILKVSPEVADRDACQMEHCISSETLERILSFIDFLKCCPKVGVEWVEHFSRYCMHGITLKECKKCMNESLLTVEKRFKDDQIDKIYTLDTLKPGNTCMVKRVRGRGDFRRRLIEMGVLPGTMVEVERIAPLGDPIKIKVKGYHLSLRKKEASTIDVQRIE